MSQCICAYHPGYGLEVNWQCHLHGVAADTPHELDAIADAVLAYKPKPKTKAAKRRKRRAQNARRKRR